MQTMNRRELLRKGAAIGSGIAAGSRRPGKSEACPAKKTGSKWDHEYDFGHKMLFMEEYYQSTMNILGCLSGEFG